jgi:hypothetical protein
VGLVVIHIDRTVPARQDGVEGRVMQGIAVHERAVEVEQEVGDRVLAMGFRSRVE